MVTETADVDDVVAREFEAFFADRFVPLSRLAYLLTGSASAADEIAQEACESVFLRWSTIEHPRSYARAAVVNGARSWARHHRLAERIPPDTDRSIELNDDAIVLRQALRRLTEPEREVVVLRFYADLKVDDIAAEVGLPPGTVKSLLHRTLAKLNKELS